MADAFLSAIYNSKFSTKQLPILILAFLHENPTDIACLIMPFHKVPLYLGTYPGIPNKILEWRLQNAI